MKTKTLLAALVLVAAPAMSFAACFGHENDQVTMSCAEGTVFDADTKTCVPLTSS